MTVIKKKQINAGKDVWKKKLYCIVGGNVNQYYHYGNQWGNSSKTEISFDLTIPLIAIFPKQLKSTHYEYTHTDVNSSTMYIRSGKQPTGPSTGECIRKTQCFHNRVQCSYKKAKLEIFVGMWMQSENIVLNISDKQVKILHGSSYMRNTDKEKIEEE